MVVARRGLRVFASLLLALFVGACSDEGEEPSSIPTPTPRVERPVGERMIDIGGYRLALRCYGQSAPTVIVENGGFPVQDVFGAELSDEVAREFRVCTYDRAGTGESEIGPNPRDARQISNELDLLLKAAGESGPYVLVTWSAGAFYTPVFAAEHPDDVAGYVFIDPRLAEYHAEVGISEEIRELASAFPSPYVEELEAWDESVAQVREAGALPPRPLVVLTAGSPESIAELDSEPGGYELWRSSHAEFAATVPDGRQVVVADAGHRIWASNPDAVLDAIRSVASVAAD